MGDVVGQSSIILLKEREEGLIISLVLALKSNVLALLPVDLGGLSDGLIVLDSDLLDQLLVGEVRVLFEGLIESSGIKIVPDSQKPDGVSPFSGIAIQYHRQSHYLDLQR